MYFIDTQRDIIYYIHDVKYDVTYIRFYWGICYF